MIKTAEDIRQEAIDKCMALPKETRQKFIDLLHEGKNVGQAMEATGVDDTLVAGQIILLSAKTYSYLPKESI